MMTHRVMMRLQSVTIVPTDVNPSQKVEEVTPRTKNHDGVVSLKRHLASGWGFEYLKGSEPMYYGLRSKKRGVGYLSRLGLG